MARTPEQVMTDMLSTHKEITGQQLSPNDFHRDEVVRLWPHAGAISAFEMKLENVEDDFHPSTSSEQGLVKHLKTRQLPQRAEPQKSQGRISFPGVDGTIVSRNGISARRNLDGKIYNCIQDGVVVGGVAVLSFESSLTGQEYNIDQINEGFTLVNPVVGLQPNGQSVDQFRNGRDQETPGEMLLRIQEHDRRTNTGGNLVAYEKWAKEASPQVVSAKAIKHPRGESTVDTVITSGTTNIDKAVEDGTAITRIPSNDLINSVQAFITQRMPTTDDHRTIAPTEENFNTEILLVPYDATKLPLIQNQITKIWKIFTFKAKSGERIYPTDLEKLIDSKVGFLLHFRRVVDFTPDHYYDIPANKILVPNDLTFGAP